MSTKPVSGAATEPIPYPTFRLKVVLSTAVLLLVSLLIQQSLMDLAEGIAYHAFDFRSSLAKSAIVLVYGVLPLVAIGMIIVRIYVSPLHKVLKTIHAGRRPSERDYNLVLRILVYFPYLLLTLNVVGFVLEYLLGARGDRLATPEGIARLLQYVAGGAVCAYVQITIGSILLAKPRKLLRIHYFGSFREPSNSWRNMLITVSLSLFALFTAVSVGQSINNSTQLSLELYKAVADGTKSLEVATADYRAAVAKIRGLSADRISPPRVDGGTGQAALVYCAILAFLGGLAVFIQLMSSRSLRGQFRTLKSKLLELGEGNTDLNERVLISQFDEVGELSDAINRFIGKLRSLLMQFVDASEGVTRSSTTLHEVLTNAAAITDEMVASIAQVNANAVGQSRVVETTESSLATMLDSLDRVSINVEAQASSVEETSAAIAEMAASIASVNETTTKANAVAVKLTRAAQIGKITVENTAKAVRNLSAYSEQVTGIVATIAAIADKTNLLAMNAAIEAAHAGSAGTGFAVVAKEVRNLAENSAASAREIERQITEMSKLIEIGVGLSTESAQSLDGIERDITTTITHVDEIAAMMREQNDGAREIVTSMSALVTATHEIRSITNEQKRNNAAMRDSIGKLVLVFSEIRGAADEQANGNQEIIEGIANLQDVENENREIVNRLHSVLSSFQLREDLEPVFEASYSRGANILR